MPEKVRRELRNVGLDVCYAWGSGRVASKGGSLRERGRRARPDHIKHATSPFLSVLLFIQILVGPITCGKTTTYTDLSLFPCAAHVD